MIVLRLKELENIRTFFILIQSTKHLNPYLGLIQVRFGGWAHKHRFAFTFHLSLLCTQGLQINTHKAHAYVITFSIRFLQAVKTGTFPVHVW